jgi:hypothetical protein
MKTSPAKLTLALCSLLVACGEPALDDPHPETGTASAALDDDGTGGVFGDGEPIEPIKPAPPPHVPTARERLDAAEAAFGFTPSDPAKWSDTKKKEICEIFAASIRARFQSALAFQPAYDACMTGQDQELGMWTYQTLAMRRVGFMPSAPDGWTIEYMKEVCKVPDDDVRKAVTSVYGGAAGYSYGKMAAMWCRTFGEVGPWTDMHDPPSGWDYANWEFRAWKRSHPINWGENTDDQTPISLPK